MRRAALAFALALAMAAPAAAQVRDVRTSGPKPFGVLLGDVFTLRTSFVADAPYTLDPASLPKTGALTYAIDLRRLDVTESAAPGGGVRYEITAEYQTFYSALETRTETVPQMSLSVVDGKGGRKEFKAGGWAYITSPLRPLITTSGETQYDLRPDAVPPRISLRPAQTAALWSAGAALLALLLLAWSRAWPPFHTRPSRPFTRAARVVAKRAPTGEAGWREALIDLHRAFDATAGKRLLGDDLGAFLAQRPAFARHEAGIRAFFDASRRVFFGGAAPAATGLSADALTRLARDLAGAERAS
ncbi:hypothetical protein GCM10008171_00970 [Methylopila jiangsuensis]|uniref:MxaA protein n=1 Tax=Methylopila jiangsuensis TaxID=586230 RepID=A0A9W6N245_9HYPH|nr:hypothetical protein [Methylopila jiangsuensis]MDR6287195.1 mxaA protein [Methylopila jiangsuensis]GLK74845.1 hypothetical protein GCM10008171_00970 [Methylopila jiangsuensis]